MKNLYLIILLFFISILTVKSNYNNKVKSTEINKTHINSRSKSNRHFTNTINKNTFYHKNRLKANDANLYGIDSIAYFETEGESFGYEKYYWLKGNISHIHYYQLVEYPDKFQLLEKVEKMYDENDNITSTIVHQYNATINDYIGSFKDEVFYNENNYKIEVIEYNWNIHINKWNKQLKLTYNYDSSGNETTMLEYNWDAVYDKWDLKFKDSSENENNLRTHWISYEYKNNNFKAIAEEFFVYDANDNQTEWYSQYLDDNTNEWVKEYKDIYSYLEDDKMNKILKFNWDNEDSTWIGELKTDFLYEKDGNLYVDSEITSYLQQNGNYWIPVEKISNTFDEVFILSHKKFSWDSDKLKWNYEFGSEYFYENLNKLRLNNHLNFLSNKINLFPMPVNDVLNFEIPNEIINTTGNIDYNLINSIGNIVLTGKFDNSTGIINVSSIPSGLYFLKINMEKQSLIKKVIKE